MTNNTNYRKDISIRNNNMIKVIPLMDINNSYKFLGVLRNTNQDYSDRYKKNKQIISIMLNNAYKSIISPSQVIQIYNKYVVPSLVYNAAQGNYEMSILQDTQNKFSRCFYSKFKGKQYNSPKHLLDSKRNLGLGMIDIVPFTLVIKMSQKIKFILREDKNLVNSIQDTL